MKRSTCLSLIVLLAACALPAVAADSYQGSFQRTFQVTGPVQLEVLTHSGDITVHSGPAGSVSISGKIHTSDRWFSSDRQADISEVEKNPPIRQRAATPSRLITPMCTTSPLITTSPSQPTPTCTAAPTLATRKSKDCTAISTLKAAPVTCG